MIFSVFSVIFCSEFSVFVLYSLPFVTFFLFLGCVFSLQLPSITFTYFVFNVFVVFLLRVWHFLHFHFPFVVFFRLFFVTFCCVFLVKLLLVFFFSIFSFCNFQFFLVTCCHCSLLHWFLFSAFVAMLVSASLDFTLLLVYLTLPESLLYLPQSVWTNSLLFSRIQQALHGFFWTQRESSKYCFHNTDWPAGNFIADFCLVSQQIYQCFLWPASGHKIQLHTWNCVVLSRYLDAWVLVLFTLWLESTVVKSSGLSWFVSASVRVLQDLMSKVLPLQKSTLANVVRYIGGINTHQFRPLKALWTSIVSRTQWWHPETSNHWIISSLTKHKQSGVRKFEVRWSQLLGAPLKSCEFSSKVWAAIPPWSNRSTLKHGVMWLVRLLLYLYWFVNPCVGTWIYSQVYCFCFKKISRSMAHGW